MGSSRVQLGFSTSVQQEILPRVSVDVGFFRRWYGNLGLGTPTGGSGGVNFITSDDRSLTPADFDTFCITAPRDSRRPGGGGYQVCGLYDIKRASFGLGGAEMVTFAKRYGKQVQDFNGFDFVANARLPQTVLVQGGVSLGKTTLDTCEVVDALPARCSSMDPPLFRGRIVAPRHRS